VGSTEQGLKERFRILCHNVFWFQGVPFEPEVPGIPDAGVFEDLVAMYLDLDPYVICLQEIQSHEVFLSLKHALGMEGEYRAGGVLQQYGGSVLWKSGTGFGPCGWSDDPPQRMWQQATVPGSGKLLICNVHLPSNRQLGREGSRLRRIEELGVATLAEPSLVLGDYNEAPGGPVSEFMQSLGYLDVAEMVGRTQTPTSINGNRGDQIWLHGSAGNRLLGYDVIDIADMETGVSGKTYLSDHLPLWIDLEMEEQ